jgi:O-succinylbenzoic acid--CoA ligase
VSPLIHIAHHQFTWNIIRSNDPIPESLHAYEKQALLFCREWLQGKMQIDIFTSGSTGVPKTISLTRQQVVASAHATARALGLAKGDHILVSIDIRYIAGKMMLIRGLELGLTMTISRPVSYPFKYVSNPIFDFTSLVPLQLWTIFERYPDAVAYLNSMKAILVGGASLPLDIEEKIQHIKAPVYASYGMTETASHIALRRVNGLSRAEYYTALPDVFLKKDERDCLIVKGLMTNDQWITTNDHVELLSDSQFKWIGRVDFVINTGGVKIYPEQVEKKVERVFHDLTIKRRFVISSVSDRRLGEKIILVIEGELLDKLTEQFILNKLKAICTLYDYPQDIRYVYQFPETPTGKIDRSRLRSEIK